jgi:hypothetical protein
MTRGRRTPRPALIASSWLWLEGWVNPHGTTLQTVSGLPEQGNFRHPW